MHCLKSNKDIISALTCISSVISKIVQDQAINSLCIGNKTKTMTTYNCARSSSIHCAPAIRPKP